MQSLKNRLKKLDKFGEGINFMVDGGGGLKTTFGGFITLIIYLLALIYTQERFQKLIFKKGTLHLTSEHVNVIDSA